VKEMVFGVDVAASAQATWDAVVDWERQGRWLPVTKVKVVAAGPDRGLGTRFVARTGVGPLAVVDRMTVTEWDPPRRATVTKTGRVMRGSAWFEVRPLDSGRCRLVWGEALTPPPFGPLARPAGAVLALGTRAFFPFALRRFAADVAPAAGSKA
jgi:hypothetical protein